MWLFFPFLCLSAATATVFDTAVSNPLPYWEDVITEGIACLSECVLLCKVTPNCVGGRYQPKSRVCRLTMERGSQPGVMFYKGTNVISTDVTFGVRCNSGTLQKIEQKFLASNDIKSFHSSSESFCRSYCLEQFWCRSFEVRNNVDCFVSGVSSLTHPLSTTTTFNFWNRIC